MIILKIWAIPVAEFFLASQEWQSFDFGGAQMDYECKA